MLNLSIPLSLIHFPQLFMTFVFKPTDQLQEGTPRPPYTLHLDSPLLVLATGVCLEKMVWKHCTEAT